jgi:hypothetical protein
MEPPPRGSSPPPHQEPAAKTSTPTEEPGASEKPSPDKESGSPGAELAARFDSLSVEARWERLVHQLRQDFGSSGVRYERFYPESFEHGELHLLGEPKFVDIFDVPEEQQRLKSALEHHIGGDWHVDIEAVESDGADEQTFDDKTLAAKREAEWRQRREDLREHVREHEAVQQARDLFGVPDDRIQIEVELDDE